MPRNVPSRNNTIPVPHPDGGIFHLVPMDALELKRLAKSIVRFEYLTDPRGRHVFNPKGAPVPKVEQDDDAVVDEAMRRCPKITDLAFPVFDSAGEPVLDDEGNQKRVPVVADNSEAPIEIGANKVIPRELRRQILCEISETEAEGSAVVEDTEDPGKEAEVEETPVNPDPEKTGNKKPKKRKVEQLVAEWVIEECVRLGRSKRETEEKNS